MWHGILRLVIQVERASAMAETNWLNPSKIDGDKNERRKMERELRRDIETYSTQMSF